MSIAGAVTKLLVAAVVDELRGVPRRFVRGLKGKAPHAEPSQPLSHRDMTHIQGQIRQATMRPPPKR